MSGQQPGRVTIVLADGTEIQGFDEYRIRQNIEEAGGSFTATLAPVYDPGIAEAVRASPRTTVLVDGAPQIVGRVGEADCQADRNGSQMAITGMDLLGLACRSALPLGFSAAGMTCVEALTAAFAPWGLEVILSNDENRELVSTRRIREDYWDQDQLGSPVRVAEATEGYEWTVGNRHLNDVYMQWLHEAGRVRLVNATREIEVPSRDERELLPMPGEKIGSWVGRICEHYRLLCWLTGDGKVVLGRPRYDQAVIPLQRGGVGQEGTIQSGGPLVKPIDQPARQQVTGRVGRHGETPIFAEATDAVLLAADWKTLAVEADEGLRDLAAAQAKADRLMHDAQLHSWVYRARLAGHAIGRRLPCPDMMFHVTDAKWAVDADLYCTARTFAKGRMSGTVVDLTLVRPNLLAAA